jgi:hydrogenase maturation protease
MLYGRVGFLGIGNVDRADDGAGILLASLLRERGVGDVYDGGVTPEKMIFTLNRGGYNTVVFLDAVDAGAEPGAVVIASSGEFKSRFPQVSTHKLSLLTLAQLLDTPDNAHVWLIGIQPQTIEWGTTAVSDAVGSTIHLLAGQIAEAMSLSVRAHQEQLCN